MLFTITIEEDQDLTDIGMVPINRTIEFEAETLNQVLQGMADSLRSAGFTYVSELVAVKENGNEVSSESTDNYNITLTVDDFLKDLYKTDTKPRGMNPTHLRVVENGQEETEK